jgi:hypothetical protein
MTNGDAVTAITAGDSWTCALLNDGIADCSDCDASGLP